VRWKLEEACWHWSHAHCRCWRRRHAPSTQTEPQVEPATSVGVILPETTIHVVMLATVVATTVTLSSNSCNGAFFNAFYFRSTETVRWERHVSYGSERLQSSACVKKLAEVDASLLSSVTVLQVLTADDSLFSECT